MTHNGLARTHAFESGAEAPQSKRFAMFGRSIGDRVILHVVVLAVVFFVFMILFPMILPSSRLPVVRQM
ncbi:MAG: hypothetical protein HY301_13195 [Verrucomicrobia bacterium]|nr:hypothetical protein [Verrucomicrobiota bacterium]